MSILSIQSLVAYGHAGNSAALFPLQRLGKEVWPVMTVHFSNHTGYGAWRGPLLSAADVAEIIAGIEDRGVLGQCEAVLSGYQGAEDVGAVILDAVATVKSHNPRAVYCCDPVMGDVGRGMFVRPGIPEFMRDQVVPAADLITPNHFELDFLAGTATGTLAELLAAADRVREAGPDVVLVTSVIVADTPEDRLDMVVVSAAGAWRTRTPRLPVNPQGAGDLTTAVFLANHLNNRDDLDARARPDDLGQPDDLGRPDADAGLDTVLARTASSVFAVVETTAAAGAPEMLIVESQDRLAHPRMEFEPERIR